jgi:hypothetical protein
MRDSLIHPIQHAQERGFATTRRPDKGSDTIGGDFELDLLQRLSRSVKEVSWEILSFGSTSPWLPSPGYEVGGPTAGTIVLILSKFGTISTYFNL